MATPATHPHNTQNRLQQVITAQPAQDGDGVKIQRIAGRHLNLYLDPFLLIDEMNSDEAADYIGGFPPHPHRGFDTITYMIEGSFRHRDSMGNEGVIRSGGVQWMSAARGVIHSEMPEQDNGQLHGFQLWLNLPAHQKMQAPAYRDFSAEELPKTALANGVQITAIAGDALINEQTVSGPLYGAQSRRQHPSAPVILDLSMPAHADVELSLPASHQALVYVYQGDTQTLDNHQLGAFEQATKLQIQAQRDGARVLVLGGIPIREPIVQHGPFVMNSIDEIKQAVEDYQKGNLVVSSAN